MNENHRNQQTTAQRPTDPFALSPEQELRFIQQRVRESHQLILRLTTNLAEAKRIARQLSARRREILADMGLVVIETPAVSNVEDEAAAAAG